MKKQAFTLVELLVTMSLMAILFAISAPIFSDFQSSSRIKSSAEIFESSFGEAFSGARSRPECFEIESGVNLDKFSIKSYEKHECGQLDKEKIIIEYEFNPGVKISRDFRILFRPPFGDIEFFKETGDSMEIDLCNKECVSFVIYAKSGLIERKSKKEIKDSFYTEDKNLNPAKK